MGLLRSLGACFGTTFGLVVAVSVACSTGVYHPPPHVSQGVTVSLLGSGLALTGGLAHFALARVPAVLGFGPRRR